MANLHTLEHRRACYSLPLVHKALVSKCGPKYINEPFQIQQSSYHLREGNLRSAQLTANGLIDHLLVSRLACGTTSPQSSEILTLHKFKHAIEETNLTSGTLCNCNIWE